MIPPLERIARVIMAAPGSRIEGAVSHAFARAHESGVLVLLWFNDVILPIEPGASALEAIARYHAQCNWREMARAGSS